MGIFDLTGKVAIVTGASRGIGEALAKGLAEQVPTVAVDFDGVFLVSRAAGRQMIAQKSGAIVSVGPCRGGSSTGPSATPPTTSPRPEFTC